MAINFLSLGWLKRIKAKWFVNLFFNISRFFRLITFSFLYESIYYTLISNVSKKAIGIILLTYVIVINSYWMVNYNEDIFNPRQSHILKPYQYKILYQSPCDQLQGSSKKTNSALAYHAGRNPEQAGPGQSPKYIYHRA